MGLQHLADGNQKRAVKSLSKAIFYCYLHDLKWELVRAAHDLKVRCELASTHVVLLCSTHICHQHADASAVSSDELAAISRIPDNFLECPGSRPLILRLEVHALPCCSRCPLTAFLYFQRQFWMRKYITSSAFRRIRSTVTIIFVILSLLACLYTVL
jgi:hypothetical protein